MMKVVIIPQQAPVRPKLRNVVPGTLFCFALASRWYIMTGMEDYFVDLESGLIYRIKNYAADQEVVVARNATLTIEENR